MMIKNIGFYKTNHSAIFLKALIKSPRMPEKNPKNPKEENVVILGAGIAGLTAALYNARANLSPLVVTGLAEGGQLMLTTNVENYPGFPEGIQGPELMDRIKKQTERFGARFVSGDVDFFEAKKGRITVGVGGRKITAKAAIIATGASARTLGIESEKKYWARGIHTCAVCDGYFYKGKDVIVVGGGDSAAEDSLFLSKLAKSITIVVRSDKMKASKIMQDRVKSSKMIKFLWNTEVREFLGDGKVLTGVKLINNKTNQITERKINGVFLAIGQIPNTKVFQGKVELTDYGFVKTDSRLRTSIEGVFAAGDVMDPLYKQAATAAGTGCAAAIEVERHINSLRHLERIK